MGINVYQILRYQPNGPGGQNTYTSTAALFAASDATPGRRIITIDDSLAPGGATFDTVGMPAGGWNLDGVELQGITNFNNTAGVAILSLAAGVKFNTSSLKLSLLQLTCAPAAAPVISVPALGELWLYLDIAEIMVTGGAAPFLRVDNAGFADIFMAHDSTIGDGTHVVADAGAGPSNLFVLGYASFIEAGAVTGAGATIRVDDAGATAPQAANITMDPLSSADEINVETAFGVDTSGATDAAPQLTVALAVLTARGQAARCPGTPKLSTVVTVPACARLHGDGIDKTIFTSTIAAGPPLNCAFLGTDTYGAVGTLHTTPTLYGNTLTSTTAVTKYQWIEIGTAPGPTTVYVEIFQVIGVAGPVAGVYTYTLDRAIERPFQAGDTFEQITVPLLGVELSDFSIGGTGTRAIDLIGAIRSKCHDFTVGPDAAGNYFSEGGSFDTGGFENTWGPKAAVIGGGVMNHGLLHESACRALTVDSSTDYCNDGQSLWDCIDSEVRNARGDGCGSRVVIGGDSALTTGFLNCRAIGGSGAGNGKDYEVDNGIGCSIVAPGGNGATLCTVLVRGTNTTTGRAFGVSIEGGASKDANSSAVVTGGAIVLLNAAGVTINGVAIESPTTAGLNIQGTAVTDVSGDLGTVRNVAAGGGRQAGILQQCVGATGKIVGPVVDTAAYGVHYDNGGTFSRFIVDGLMGQNLSSGLVAGVTEGIFGGTFFKSDGATSVDVRDVRTVVCIDTNPTTVTQPMLNAYDGQPVDYIARNANTTVNRSNAYLAGGADWVSTSVQAGAATLGLIYQAALAAAIERYRVNTNA